MAPHEELLQKIGIVRSRWKAFLWLRGLAWVLGVTVLSLVIGLSLANSSSISGWTVTALRLGLLAARRRDSYQSAHHSVAPHAERHATGAVRRRKEPGVERQSRQRRRRYQECPARATHVRSSFDKRCARPDEARSVWRPGEQAQVQHIRSADGSLCDCALGRSLCRLVLLSRRKRQSCLPVSSSRPMWMPSN